VPFTGSVWPGHGVAVAALSVRVPRRQAVLTVNVILEWMIYALRRGWEVGFPRGKLKQVKRHFSKLWDAIDDSPANRDPDTIVHELDEAGDRTLHSWAWPKTGAADARSRRSMNSSPHARRRKLKRIQCDCWQSLEWKSTLMVILGDV
jgi:hypothetical protein